jgi:multisubunit Na+/H+ antiporter MnhG subunit
LLAGGGRAPAATCTTPGAGRRFTLPAGFPLLAIVLIVLAILLGLGGLLFTALKWLLIVAVVLLIAGVVAGVLGRGKTRSLR